MILSIKLILFLHINRENVLQIPVIKCSTACDLPHGPIEMKHLFAHLHISTKEKKRKKYLMLTFTAYTEYMAYT